jgi:hypothetical protein
MSPSIAIFEEASHAPASRPLLVLTVSVDKSGTVTLRWTDTASNETGVSIERAPKSKHPTCSVVGTVGANAPSWQQSTPSGQSQFRVQAYNANGSSDYSNVVTIRVR